MSHYQWVKSHYLPINSHKRWCFNVTPPPVFVMPLVYTPKEHPHPLRLRFYPWDPRGIFGDAFFVGHPLRVATSRSRDQEMKMAQRTRFGIGIRSPNWSGETTQNSSVIFKAQIGDGVCDWENATFRESANYKFGSKTAKGLDTNQ